MSKPNRRRKGPIRRQGSERKVLELLQRIHGFGSLGFLLALSSVSPRAPVRKQALLDNEPADRMDSGGGQ